MSSCFHAGVLSWVKKMVSEINCARCTDVASAGLTQLYVALSIINFDPAFTAAA